MKRVLRGLLRASLCALAVLPASASNLGTCTPPPPPFPKFCGELNGFSTCNVRISQSGGAATATPLKGDSNSDPVGTTDVYVAAGAALRFVPDTSKPLSNGAAAFGVSNPFQSATSRTAVFTVRTDGAAPLGVGSGGSVLQLGTGVTKCYTFNVTHCDFSQTPPVCQSLDPKVIVSGDQMMLDLDKDDEHSHKHKKKSHKDRD